MEQLALIALGSNLGDSRAIISEALECLQSLSDEIILRSSFWQTTPVDCPPGAPPFVNAAVALVPRKGETPESLLTKLQVLERDFGRRPKKIFNEPRPLDLDLISFGNEMRTSEALVLPHPRAHLRKFVLQPLAEIAPACILPGLGGSIAKLLGDLKSNESVVRIQH